MSGLQSNQKLPEKSSFQIIPLSPAFIINHWENFLPLKSLLITSSNNPDICLCSKLLFFSLLKQPETSSATETVLVCEKFLKLRAAYILAKIGLHQLELSEF